MNNEEKILEVLKKHGEMLGQMQADMTTMKADMADMKETLKQHGERLDRIDERLDHLDERSQRTALLLEVEYKQKLDLLYEGHQTIMETITPKERIDEIEADVTVLKIAVRTLSEEIKELKKAQ